jgi:spore germination protein GerM
MRRRLLVAAVLGAVLALAALWWRGRSTPAPIVMVAPDTSAGAGVQSATLYFASPDGAALVSEPREVLQSDDLHERVATLIAQLDRGSTHGGVSVLPPGTALRQVFIDNDGLLTVDLTSAFRRGFQGGSATEFMATASLVRTLSANLPEVKRVLIVCAGRPIETLGGHLPLDQPLDVTDWP